MSDKECILADGYDREVFQGLVKKSVPVAKTKERLERVLPLGAVLLQDLFSSLYKMNIVLRPQKELSGTVLIHRRILEAVIASRPLHELRKRTELSPLECAAALPVLADKILGALMREYRVDAEALGDLATLAEHEKELDDLKAQLEAVKELPEGALGDADKAEIGKSLEKDIAALKKQVDGEKNAQAKVAARLTTEIDDVAHNQLSRLPAQIDEAADLLDSMGLGRGRGADVPAEKRLELGQRLMKSKKLQLLARLVGAFREVAFEARRKRIMRSPQTLHAVRIGSDLERLLPSEVLGLPKQRHTLHLDFLRRWAEGQLLEYELIAASSRGPMVVCVDGSSSMSGSKEIWAKAVALTLMEIARREKRRCLAIVFSSGGAPTEFEFLGDRAKGGRARIIDDEVLRFAEHFPGGGTSFEEPLQRAVDAVAEGSYRRGDIVFITDGEASVSKELVDRLAHEKKKHRFSIRGILVDATHSRSDTLESFSDDVKKVSDLTGDSMADLFSAV
jgi:uncharacterized protein with von Willebrand factor type A (vWA) domain